MIPFILAAVGGYLIGDSFGDEIDSKIPKFEDGGHTGKYVKIKNYPTFQTVEEAEKFVKLGKPFLRKEIRQGKVVLAFNGEEYYLADVKEDAGMMADGGMMAKGGVSNTPMSMAKMLYNKYNRTKRKEFLMSAGYSESVSKDLSLEEWDSLEKQVHTNLAKVLQSGRRKGYGQYADGGMMAKGGVTKGEFVWLLDNDGIVEPLSIETYKKYLSNFKKSDNWKQIYDSPERKAFVSADGKSKSIFRKKLIHAKGGETFSEKAAQLKGGIKYYSVDIDLENGENVRDLEFKNFDKAKEVYQKYSKTMVYKNQPIEDIQLIVVYKNGDYERSFNPISRKRKEMAKGGKIDAKKEWDSYGDWGRYGTLEKVGYSFDEANDLAKKDWNSLGNKVQRDFEKALFAEERESMKSMMRSLFTYGGLDKNSNYLEKYKTSLGTQEFNKIFSEYSKELNSKYKVISSTYTDAEGLSYNELKRR